MQLLAGKTRQWNPKHPRKLKIPLKEPLEDSLKIPLKEPLEIPKDPFKGTRGQQKSPATGLLGGFGENLV